MRIAVVSSSVFKVPVSGYSGLEVIAWETAKGLAAKGHIVSLVAPDGSECPGCEIIPIGPERMVDEAASYGGFGELKDGDRIVRPKHLGYWQHLLGVDCIIDSSWQKYSYMLKAEGRLKCPILGVLHAPVHTMYQSLPPVEKPCFVCISKDQANHFAALFAPAKARVCYNGIDLNLYKPLNVPRSDRFLFLARFSTIKGPDLAIEACRQAGVGLDLVGDTTITGEPELYERCRRMADGKQIRIVGGVPRGECVWWYSQARAMLHPNKRFREPFGLAPVEAMACGCPVIAYDYGAMRETISKDTGWLVNTEQELAFWVKDIANAIVALKDDAPLRQRCRDQAANFSIGNMVSRYEELCNEAVQGGGW